MPETFEGKDSQDPSHAIMDSANQLMQFRFFPKFEQRKEFIAQTNFKTLEEYTHKTKNELDSLKPGICDAYNNLIERLKNPNLTEQEFDEIMKEAYQITH